MLLHSELLEQARHLAGLEPQNPTQASLRRAVSAAYYAVFHLLCYEASRLFVGDDGLAASLGRTFDHKDMMDVSKNFSVSGPKQRRLPKAFESHIDSMLKSPRFAELERVAAAFCYLQEARHRADYDLAEPFVRSEVEAVIEQAEKAFADWDAVRFDDFARLYLGCFSLWERWEKIRK